MDNVLFLGGRLGGVNAGGIAFYNRLIDALLQKGRLSLSSDSPQAQSPATVVLVSISIYSESSTQVVDTSAAKQAHTLRSQSEQVHMFGFYILIY